jgi:outer membrane usher protein FimD/PapC
MRLALALLALSLTPALAEPVITGGLHLGLTTEEQKGKRQTAGLAMDVNWGGPHVGLSYDAYNDSAENELQAILGYRTMLGAVDLDATYTRKSYPAGVGDCCGRVALDVIAPLGPVTGRLDLGHDPDVGGFDGEVGLEYPLATTAGLSLWSSYEVERELGGSKSTAVELGARYQIGAASSLSANLRDANDEEPSVGVDLDWRFSLIPGGAM